MHGLTLVAKPLSETPDFCKTLCMGAQIILAIVICAALLLLRWKLPSFVTRRQRIRRLLFRAKHLLKSAKTRAGDWEGILFLRGRAYWAPLPSFGS